MTTELLAKNFLGLDRNESDYKKSKVVVIPAPFEASTSYQKGTHRGPEAIIHASGQVEHYDIEFGKNFHDVGIHTIDPLPLQNTPAAEAFKIVEEATTKILKDKKWPVLLGGEHAISYGFFKALFKKYRHLSIFHIDAHTDMRESYEGNPYSHASVLYQIRKDCQKTVSIGIRSMCKEEADYVKKNKVVVYYDHEIQRRGLIEKEILKQLTDQVYVTIDVDGFSPSIIPTTGTPEPGGLEWYPTLALLRGLFKEKEVIGMDVVEVMPIPNLVYGDFSVAKLIYKCIGYKYFQS